MDWTMGSAMAQGTLLLRSPYCQGAHQLLPALTQSGIKSPFSRFLIRTGARRNPATCATHPGKWKRRFAPPLRAGGPQAMGLEEGLKLVRPRGAIPRTPNPETQNLQPEPLKPNPETPEIRNPNLKPETQTLNESGTPALERCAPCVCERDREREREGARARARERN